MQQLRALLFRHRAVATLVVLAALCIKMALPGGYMIGSNSKVLTVQLCADASGSHFTKQIVIPMKGDSGEPSGKQGKSECAFASLSMASLSGADPVLLALALAFILALGIAPVRPSRLNRTHFLRPPLRGPPALI
jgi:hypothetical protein